MKSSGYTMLGSFQETQMAFLGSARNPIVAPGSNRITVPSSLQDWANQAKSYSANGYALNTGMWSGEWYEGMEKNTKIFGYYGPTWYVGVLEGSVSDKGNWDACAGPVASYWGGSAIYAANGTDNAAIVKGVIEFFCVDKDSMKKLATDGGQCVNNISVLRELGDNSMRSDFFASGYLPLNRFADDGIKIDIKNSKSEYFGLLEQYINAISNEYILGNTPYEEALELFYNDAIDRYPGLQR
jgi:hypothetical protein